VTGATVARFTVLGPSRVSVSLESVGRLERVRKLFVYLMATDTGREHVVAVFDADLTPANLIADFAVNLSRKAVR
jgi:hypothetical protein